MQSATLTYLWPPLVYCGVQELDLSKELRLMKSERRHELQHNELAEWLAKTFLVIKPYQNMIFLAVVLSMALAVGYMLWARMSSAQTAKAWDAVSTAIDSGAILNLAGVIEEYPNTSAAQMAAVVLADYYLGDGCNQLFSNKANGQDLLNKAIRLYDSVLEQNSYPSIVERATYGLARAKEAKGELEPAEKLYAEVATQWPEGTYAEAASRRLADLKRPATKELYDRFAQFDPKPAFSAPDEKPEFDMSNLPEEGDTVDDENTDEK